MFEIKQETDIGMLHLRLNRNLSFSEMSDICKLIENITLASVEHKQNLQSYKKQTNLVPMGQHSQSKMGQYPQISIPMGSYIEPDDGFIIKFFYLLEEDQEEKAISSFKDATGIERSGCRAILRGNFNCPILTKDIAQTVLKDLKEIKVHAKMIAAP